MSKLIKHARSSAGMRRWSTPCSSRGLAAGAILASTILTAQASDPTSVQTKEGPVKGFLTNGIAEFRGIPYAAAPVGDLRWRPPVPHAPWTKVLEATKFGPQCLQVTTLGPFAGPPNDNEDCLYLNVYSPRVDPAPKEKLPVIVWIHGGGNVDGASDAYNGKKLARQGHTVVVTINYRLGLLGFLAHPSLDAEGHPFGNYGILDQQAALRWVKRNIDQFGGDRNNVTLGGQSAGSIDTESNMISPLAAGLFDRAIVQSILLEPAPLPAAEANGKAFAAAAGCGSGPDPTAAKCLRALSAHQIFKLSGTPSTQAPYETILIADGQILPKTTFVAAIQNGKFNHMPVMSGQTQDELTFSLGITEYFKSPRVPASKADYQATIDSFNSKAYPPNTAAKVAHLYPLSVYAAPELALDRILTDPLACAQRHTNLLLASQVPVYMYEFNDRTAPSYFPQMPGFQPLAYHTGDIQYLFPGWHGGNLGIPHDLNDKQAGLSNKLVAAWTNFAAVGNPNGQGNSPWPRYNSQPNSNTPAILSEDIPALTTFTNAQYDAAHQCKFWDSVSTY